MSNINPTITLVNPGVLTGKVIPAPLRHPLCYIRFSSIWVVGNWFEMTDMIYFQVKLFHFVTKCAQIWEHMFYAKGKQRQRHDITNIRLIQRDKQHSKNWKRLNKNQRIPEGQSNMNNPEKLATIDTQDEEKQNKNTTQYGLHTTICKQTQIRWRRHAPYYKQLEIKTKQKI